MEGKSILVVLVIIIMITTSISSMSRSSESSYYPIKVIFDQTSYLDSLDVVSMYGSASTYDNAYEAEDDIINFGVSRLISPNLFSYYDNNYPYTLTITDPADLNELADVANVIKTSKIAIIAVSNSIYDVDYDSSTQKLIIYSKIQINSGLYIDRYLGYYNYENNVPPDNSPTRLVILASHASAVYYSNFWESYYSKKYGIISQSDDNTVSEGLYSIDAVIAIDSYPMILYANGQEYKFNPKETPYPLYWPYIIATLEAEDYNSYIGRFINYLFLHLEQEDTIKNAYYKAIDDLSYNTYDALPYCYIMSYWSGTSNTIPPYSGNPRIVIIFNSASGNTPVVRDPAPPLPPCPPDSPYCNIPLNKPYNEINR